jgi:hypothetical protein
MFVSSVEVSRVSPLEGLALKAQLPVKGVTKAIQASGTFEYNLRC